MYRLFPFPAQLTHTLTILLALSTGVAAFVVLRRLEGVGYAIEWVRGSGWIVLSHFLLFAAIAVPLGIGIGFITYDPSVARLRSLPVAVIGITFFTAWPEEFLFRGVLQNLFSRTLKSQWIGLGRGICYFWFIAYSSCAISELEVCDSRNDRWSILRARVDENWLAATGSTRACARGYFLACDVSLSLPSVLM